VSFFADAQVTISDKAADYFLEVDDKFHILETQIHTEDVIIKNLQQQVLTQKLIIKTYSDPIKGDSVEFRKMIATKDEQMSLKDKENKFLKRSLVKQKILTWVFVIGFGAVLVKDITK